MPANTAAAVAKQHTVARSAGRGAQMATKWCSLKVVLGVYVLGVPLGSWLVEAMPTICMPAVGHLRLQPGLDVANKVSL